MRNLAYIVNARVASAPTFFPNAAGDAKKHRAVLTLMKNYRRNGQDIRTDTFSVWFWGKLARLACHRMPIGTSVTIVAEPRDYPRRTGRIKANGKEEIYRETSYHVVYFEFGQGLSNKAQNAIVTGNIAKLKAAGIIPADCTVTSEQLLESKLPEMQDYNPLLAQQTGMYGNAKVYIKDSGFVKPVAAAAGAQNVDLSSLNLSDPSDLQKLAGIVKEASAQAAPGEVKDAESPIETDAPFPDAQ